MKLALDKFHLIYHYVLFRISCLATKDCSNCAVVRFTTLMLMIGTNIDTAEGTAIFSVCRKSLLYGK